MKASDTTATSLDLQSRLIGCLLVNGGAIHELPAGFDSGCLDDPKLSRIFTTLDHLAKTNRLPSGRVDHALVIATGGFTDKELPDLSLLESMADSYVLRGTTVRDHAAALLDKRRRTQMLMSLHAAQKEIQANGDLTEIAGHLTSQLLDLDAKEQPEVISYRDAALEFIQFTEDVKSGKSRVVRTGLRGIDKILRMRPGNLIIIGARSKVGKTTIARQITGNVAKRREHVAFHSLEMSVPEVVALDVSRSLSIDSMDFFDGDRKFTTDEWSAIHETLNRRLPEGTNGFVHANHYQHSIGAICRITEKLHRQHRLSLAVVDYLQLVQCDLGKNANREQVVATISRTLKALAMRLGIPILALAQLSRKAVERGERPWRPRKKKQPKRDPMAMQGAFGAPPPETEPPEVQDEEEPLPPPQLHDLRESGAIEQDANAICFLHHPFDQSANPHKREHGPFSFIVAAQRLGPKGTVKLHAQRNYSRFHEVES